VEKQATFGGWVRIDDRLIHGQVTVGWYQYLRYREIWVVDDALRGDTYLWDALQLAAPAGVEVRVMGLEEAVEAMAEEETPKVRSRGRPTVGAVLVLVRDPEGVLALAKGGVLLDRVNVGNLGSRPGSVRAIKNVSLTESHVAALDALAERGIEVFFQLAPEDARVEWETVRRRMRR
jgi:mannose/fructose/N-acetylgalactosamine-specific phosphotransferase system component IIB